MVQVQSLSDDQLIHEFDVVCRDISFINAGGRLTDASHMRLKALRARLDELKQEHTDRNISYSTAGYLL